MSIAPPHAMRSTIGHLLVGVPWGLAWTTVVAGGMLAGAAAFPVGVPIAAATLLLVPLGAELERDRAASLVGARPVRPEPMPAGPLRRRLRTHVRSRSTWREALYLVAFGPLAFVQLALAAAWLTATVAALTSGFWLADGAVAVGPIVVVRPLLVTLLAVNGTAALLAAPLLARGLVAVHCGVTARLLGGPDRRWEERAEEAERRQEFLTRAARAERERIERDLHDGLQPVLVAAAMTIAGARRSVTDRPERAAADLDEAQALLRAAMHDVRALVQGLAPRSLRETGLDAALGELAAGSPVAVTLDVRLDHDVDDECATAAYFVASEALTNVVRHGAAAAVSIRVVAAGGRLDVMVVDDGIGGATPRPGHGLDGLDARVRACGGELTVESPPGVGTTVRARLPATAAGVGPAPSLAGAH